MTDACWSTIGVRGDRSCPELTQYIHCRNCPVHAAAAVALLETRVPVDYLADWTRHAARPPDADDPDSGSVVIFRVDAEWLALRTAVVAEVIAAPSIHSLPHHRRTATLGVANVRGQLLVCASLGRILGLDVPAGGVADPAAEGRHRLLVLHRDGIRAACPVHEVHGIHRFHQRDLKALPATLDNSATRFSMNVLSWETRSVGLLDDALLFAALKRGLA